MGFDPNVAILFSGIGTLIFFAAVGGRVPSYLGSSFSFIAVVIAATGYAGSGPNANIGVALGGIIAAGVVYTAIGLVVMKVGYAWIEDADAARGHRGRRRRHRARTSRRSRSRASRAARSIPGSASRRSSRSASSPCARPGSRAACRSCSAALRAIALYALLANGFGMGKAIDFTAVAAAPWLGLPNFVGPRWDAQAIALIAPVAIVLVAENLGHVKAVAAMTGQNLDPYLGRAFVGDGIATMVAGARRRHRRDDVRREHRRHGGDQDLLDPRLRGGGAHRDRARFLAEVRRADRAPFPARCWAGSRSSCSASSPPPAGASGCRTQVDFARARNLVTVAVTLTIGAGDLALKIGGFTLGGIGTATFGAILLYQLFRDDPEQRS